MTIQVTVKNADSRETAVIKVKTVAQGQDAHTVQGQELKGGAEASFYVHSSQELQISEVSQ